jgi:hypothetical protein
MNEGDQDFKPITLNLISNTKTIHVHVTSVGHTNIVISILIVRVNHWSVPRSLPMVMPLISIFCEIHKTIGFEKRTFKPFMILVRALV